MKKTIIFSLMVILLAVCFTSCDNDMDEASLKVKRILEKGNLTESDLNTVGKALMGGAPWDWLFSGEKIQNHYRLKAFETGFSAYAWNALSKDQRKLVRAYMSPSHYSTRIFKNADFSFWTNRPPRNRPNGVSDAIDYYTNEGGPDWQAWQIE